jgi:hypothetical protein
MSSERNGNKFLMLGAACSGIAALAHMGCIVFGGDWYRFLGAGEQMALMSEQGHWYPTVVTGVLVLILSIWALYALSGVKIIGKLPFLRLGLCTISGIYILRGVAFVGIMPMFPDNSLTFWLVSSGICLFVGSLYAVGTYKSWGHLKTA